MCLERNHFKIKTTTNRLRSNRARTGVDVYTGSSDIDFNKNKVSGISYHQTDIRNNCIIIINCVSITVFRKIMAILLKKIAKVQ